MASVAGAAIDAQAATTTSIAVTNTVGQAMASGRNPPKPKYIVITVTHYANLTSSCPWCDVSTAGNATTYIIYQLQIDGTYKYNSDRSRSPKPKRYKGSADIQDTELTSEKLDSKGTRHRIDNRIEGGATGAEFNIGLSKGPGSAGVTTTQSYLGATNSIETVIDVSPQGAVYSYSWVNGNFQTESGFIDNYLFDETLLISRTVTVDKLNNIDNLDLLQGNRVLISPRP